MVYMKALPSQSKLRELFTYDFETGYLSNRVKKSGVVIGSRAGCLHSKGHRRIRINQEIYAEHRVIWVWVYGSIPDGYLIDHINQNKADNRIQNLRLVTPRENNLNVLLSRPNKTDYRGVTKKHSGRYEARIRSKGRNRYLGSFDSPQEAFHVYSLAKAKTYGDLMNNEGIEIDE